jgi:adenylate cyclase
LAIQDVKRKLTTILAADVEGYTRLMRADEEATLKTLGEYRDVIYGLIARHEGRVFSTGGDSVLAEFGSAVEAVRCAISCQEEIANRNTELADDRKLIFRIGINVGDVMIRDGDLFGDGVNVAARLEGLAEPGGVCISGSVFEQIKHKLSLGFEDMGQQEVKNIAEPVSAFRLVPGQVSVSAGATAATKPSDGKRWRMPAIAVVVAVLVSIVGGAFWWQPWKPDVEPASIERMAFALPDKPSIAVLAFDNMSGDPEQDYFADGITDNIITELSRFRNLFVVARNSTFTYKGKAVKVQQVAEDLGVQYVLEGSVQRSKERMRINVQLIDAITGRHLWVERYDKELNDLFAVQDEVARQIVATLANESGRLAKAWQERTARKGTESLNAYELDLRGWQAIGPWTKEAFASAEKLFEEAIAADPEYARPYATLALILVWQVYAGLSESPDESITRARDLAKEAIARDDAESWGHWALGAVYLKQGLHDQAVAEYERALELNPNDADVLVESAWPLAWSGRPEEGIENAKTAMRLNPRYDDWYLWALGVAYFEGRQYEEAIATFESMNNRILKSRLYLAAAYAQAGRGTEAHAEVEDILERDPDSSITRWGYVQPYKFPADLEHFIDGLRKAGLPE